MYMREDDPEKNIFLPAFFQINSVILQFNLLNRYVCRK
jgi:hypothetical protein